MPLIKLDDLTKPLLALSDDFERAEKDLLANGDSYSRRNHIRALFAMVEGTIYLLKRTILVAASCELGKLSTADLAMLREETYYLEKNGNVSAKKKFPRVADNLKFTKRRLEEAFGYSLNLNTTPTSWENFLEAIEIRNRITHPKGLQAFEVSKEESELARRVGQWFIAFIGEWFTQFVSTASPVYDDALQQGNG